MSCYLRHMSGVLQEAGIKVTRENKKDIDKALHNLVNVEYKNCSPTWKEIKKLLQTEKGKKKIVKELKNLH